MYVCIHTYNIQHCQSIYITGHSTSVFTILWESRLTWEAASVWFTDKGSVTYRKSPISQVLNLASLPSGESQYYPPFLNITLSPHSWQSRRTTASPLGDSPLPEGRLSPVPSCLLCWREPAPTRASSLADSGLFSPHWKGTCLSTICLSYALICLCRSSTYLGGIKHASQMTKLSRYTIYHIGCLLSM